MQFYAVASSTNIRMVIMSISLLPIVQHPYCCNLYTLSNFSDYFRFSAIRSFWRQLRHIQLLTQTINLSIAYNHVSVPKTVRKQKGEGIWSCDGGLQWRL